MNKWLDLSITERFLLTILNIYYVKIKINWKQFRQIGAQNFMNSELQMKMNNFSKYNIIERWNCALCWYLPPVNSEA